MEYHGIITNSSAHSLFLERAVLLETEDVFLPDSGAHCVCMINWSDTEEMIPSLNLYIINTKILI